MGATWIGFAIAYPEDAPIDFDAFLEIARRYKDEDDLSWVEDDEGNGLFLEYMGSGLQMIGGLEDAAKMIQAGYMHQYSKDGWAIHGAHANNWGDCGDERTCALEAMLGIAIHPDAPAPGSGGYRAAWWRETEGIPPLSDTNEWWD